MQALYIYIYIYIYTQNLNTSRMLYWVSFFAEFKWPSQAKPIPLQFNKCFELRILFLLDQLPHQR